MFLYEGTQCICRSCCYFPQAVVLSFKCLTCPSWLVIPEGLASQCCKEEGPYPHTNILQYHMIAPIPPPTPVPFPPPPPHAPSLPLPTCQGAQTNDPLAYLTIFEAPMLQGMHTDWRVSLRRSLLMLMTQPLDPPSQPQPLGGLRQGCWRAPQLKCTRLPSLPGCTCVWESGDGQSLRFVPFAWPVNLILQLLPL